MNNVIFVGLDFHVETIAVAVAETGGQVRSLGIIPNRAESIGRMIRKLGKLEQLRVCYEAGPTGYVLYWQLSELGVKCELVAPTLIPVWVPDAAHEALGDLVRARLAAKRNQLRARHRLGKFLLRHGRRAAVAERLVRLERSIDAAIATLPVKLRAMIEALQSLRGIAQISAVTIMAEVGDLSRFEHPRQLMGYSGAVSREHSSGPRVCRGAISKAGNSHLRRIVIESVWAYRHRPAVGKRLAAHQRLWRHQIKENPREALCGSLRAQSASLVARQLPTDHDHDGECSHSIHEYQSDQPSHIAATAAVCLRLALYGP